jgi:hypothetical protein
MSHLRSRRPVVHSRQDLHWQSLSLKPVAPTLGGVVLAVEVSQQVVEAFQGLQGQYRHRIELEPGLRTGIETGFK